MIRSGKETTMLRPLAATAVRRPLTSSRVAALAAAGVMELALVGALMSGLAQRIVKELPHELTMVDLTVTTPPDEAPPVKPELVKPEVPTVPVPEIHIRRTEPVHSI